MEKAERLIFLSLFSSVGCVRLFTKLWLEMLVCLRKCFINNSFFCTETKTWAHSSNLVVEWIDYRAWWSFWSTCTDGTSDDWWRCCPIMMILTFNLNLDAASTHPKYNFFASKDTDVSSVNLHRTFFIRFSSTTVNKYWKRFQIKFMNLLAFFSLQVVTRHATL